MRYMVTYSHQKRNKDGKKLKAIETLFKYIEADNKDNAKEICMETLREKEKREQFKEIQEIIKRKNAINWGKKELNKIPWWNLWERLTYEIWIMRQYK